MNEGNRQMQAVISILIYEKYGIISHLVALTSKTKKEKKNQLSVRQPVT